MRRLVEFHGLLRQQMRYVVWTVIFVILDMMNFDDNNQVCIIAYVVEFFKG